MRRKYAPSLYTLKQLRSEQVCENMLALPNGDMVPLRSEGLWSIPHRLKLAYMVFTGKADAFTWPGDQG